MTDVKSKDDNRDRSQVAGSEDYEVPYLVEQADITIAQARELVRRYASNRKTLLEVQPGCLITTFAATIGSVANSSVMATGA